MMSTDGLRRGILAVGMMACDDVQSMAWNHGLRQSLHTRVSIFYTGLVGT
jgi:hypothetical protein